MSHPVFLEDAVQKAYEDLENARSFCDNIPGDADEDLYYAALYNLKSAQHFLNYSLKKNKEKYNNYLNAKLLLSSFPSVKKRENITCSISEYKTPKHLKNIENFLSKLK